MSEGASKQQPPALSVAETHEEGLRLFMGRGELNQTLARLVRSLNEHGIVTLEKLIELKLASGITAPDRLRDLADVQELIKIRKLDAEYADRLNPYVRTKYLELFDSVASSARETEPG